MIKLRISCLRGSARSSQSNVERGVFLLRKSVICCRFQIAVTPTLMYDICCLIISTDRRCKKKCCLILFINWKQWRWHHIFQNTKIHANFGCRLFAYAEGQAHRNAADLCMDLSEEISANFEALPFAMASDSDNDAGTSVASDSGSHGPPCRIASVVTAQQRESQHNGQFLQKHTVNS